MDFAGKKRKKAQLSNKKGTSQEEKLNQWFYLFCSRPLCLLMLLNNCFFISFNTSPDELQTSPLQTGMIRLLQAGRRSKKDVSPACSVSQAFPSCPLQVPVTVSGGPELGGFVCWRFFYFFLND